MPLPVIAAGAAGAGGAGGAGAAGAGGAAGGGAGAAGGGGLSAGQLSQGKDLLGKLNQANRYRSLAKQGRKRGPQILVLCLFLISVMLAAMMAPVLFFGSAAAAIADLTIKPVEGVANAAYAAATTCNFAQGADQSGVGAKLTTAYLVGMAFESSGAASSPILGQLGAPDGTLLFGSYRNPIYDKQLPGYDPMVGTAGLDLNTTGLSDSGATASMLNIQGGLQPGQWTTITGTLGPAGEHGVGFLMLTPTQWRDYLDHTALPADVNKSTLSPWRPEDAFLVVACHLKWQVAQLLAAGKTAAAAIAGALQAFGEGVLEIWEALKATITQIETDVKAGVILAAPKIAAEIASTMTEAARQFGAGSKGQTYRAYLEGFASGKLLGAVSHGSPVVGGGPVGAVGSFDQMPAGWHPDLPGSFYDEMTIRGWTGCMDQCTFGALGAWYSMHHADYFHDDPSQIPYLAGNANQWMDPTWASSAPSLGLAYADAPVVGSIVVYSSLGPGDPVGHVGVVVAVDQDRYKVLEQNVSPFHSTCNPGWNQFDQRVYPWPDPRAMGFVVGPKGTKIPTP